MEYFCDLCFNELCFECVECYLYVNDFKIIEYCVVIYRVYKEKVNCILKY